MLCGTGLGMSYAANRHPGVRAAVAWTPEVARLAREHNDANVLVLPGAVPQRGRGRGDPQDVAGRPNSRAAGTAAGSPKSNRSRDESRPQRLAARRRSARRPAHRPRAGPAAARARADRERELRQPGGDRRHGHPAHQQVRRGLSRPALLRRLRGHRRGRAARHRPAQAALRRRARQRAAALGRAGQLRRVHGGDPPGREDHGHVAAARRAPVARRGGQPQRRGLEGGALRRRPARPAASTTTSCASRPGASGPS